MESEGGEWEGTEHKQEHKFVSVACSKRIQERVSSKWTSRKKHSRVVKLPIG